MILSTKINKSKEILRNFGYYWMIISIIGLILVLFCFWMSKLYSETFSKQLVSDLANVFWLGYILSVSILCWIEYYEKITSKEVVEEKEIDNIYA